MDGIEDLLSHESVLPLDILRQWGRLSFEGGDIDFGLLGELSQDVSDFYQIFAFGEFVEGQRYGFLVYDCNVNPVLLELLLELLGVALNYRYSIEVG